MLSSHRELLMIMLCLFCSITLFMLLPSRCMQSSACLKRLLAAHDSALTKQKAVMAAEAHKPCNKEEEDSVTP
jgi:hypothetical protein